jgi:hypothetical protein
MAKGHGSPPRQISRLVCLVLLIVCIIIKKKNKKIKKLKKRKKKKVKMVRERDSKNIFLEQDCSPSTRNEESWSESSDDLSDSFFDSFVPPPEGPKYDKKYFEDLGIEVEGLEDDYW